MDYSISYPLVPTQKDRPYVFLKRSALEQVEGFVSATAATDIFYLLCRALKDDQAAKDNLEKLLQLVGFADALAEDVYDAIARRCRMDYIVTRNTRDFRHSPVRALTPQEFLAL